MVVNKKFTTKIILVSKFRGLDIYARSPSVSRSSRIFGSPIHWEFAGYEEHNASATIQCPWNDRIRRFRSHRKQRHRERERPSLILPLTPRGVLDKYFLACNRAFCRSTKQCRRPRPACQAFSLLELRKTQYGWYWQDDRRETDCQYPLSTGNDKERSRQTVYSNDKQRSERLRQIFFRWSVRGNEYRFPKWSLP